MSKSVWAIVDGDEIVGVFNTRNEARSTKMSNLFSGKIARALVTITE